MRLSGACRIRFPSVTRLLQEHGLKESQIRGTGLKGRVLKGDVLRALKEGVKPLTASAATQATTAARVTQTAQPARAQTTSVGAKGVPHFYTYVDCRVDEVESFTKTYLSGQVSIGECVAKAAASCLREVPELNAGSDVNLLYKRGDVSGVVSKADVRGVGSLASELKAGAQRTAVAPTFSVVDFTRDGIVGATVNIPEGQRAVLAVGAPELKIVVEQQQQQSAEEQQKSKLQNAVKQALSLQLSLSCDASIVSEERAMLFLSRVRDVLDKPVTML